MLVIVIPQPRITDNNTIEKIMAIILLLKVIDNNILKKGLVNPLVRNQLDSPAKTLTDG